MGCVPAVEVSSRPHAASTACATAVYSTRFFSALCSLRDSSSPLHLAASSCTDRLRRSYTRAHRVRACMGATHLGRQGK